MSGKVKKGFKTSPSVRIPRKTVEKHVQAAAAAADKNVLVAALRDAVAFLDRAQHTRDEGWSAGDVKRLEEIRLLSLGV